MPFYTGHLAAASNRADLLFDVEVTDPATGDFIDFTGATITVAMKPVSQTYSNPTLVGTNSNGHIVVTGPGTFEVHFTRQEMSQFAAGDLDMGITVVLAADGLTYQLFSGQLPIIDGVVQA